MTAGLHVEFEGPDRHDRPQTAHRRADADPGEAIFGDQGVDHPLFAKLIEQALGHLVGALILGDLFPHHEHALVGAHFLGHRVAQRFANGRADKLRSEEHTSELQSLMRISYAVFCLKKKKYNKSSDPEILIKTTVI